MPILKLALAILFPSISSTAVVAHAPAEQPRETSRETAPYARIFQENAHWELASSSTNQRVNCHVKEVSTMCDRTVSEVVCDDEAQILTGTYATTGRGMWKIASDNDHVALDDNERAFARFPESFVDGAGNTVAKPYHGGWCTSSTESGVTKTICISEEKGFLGGSVATANSRIVIGDAPKS